MKKTKTNKDPKADNPWPMDKLAKSLKETREQRSRETSFEEQIEKEGNYILYSRADLAYNRLHGQTHRQVYRAVAHD